MVNFCCCFMRRQAKYSPKKMHYQAVPIGPTRGIRTDAPYKPDSGYTTNPDPLNEVSDLRGTAAYKPGLENTIRPDPVKTTRDLKPDPKRSWYTAFTRECSHKGTFDIHNTDWYGGAGSVRNLVRRYESETFNQLNGRSSPLVKRSAVSLGLTGPTRCQPASAPFLSSDSTSARKVPDTFLPKSTAECSGDGHFSGSRPPRATVPAPTAPPIIPKNQFPMMALPIPPPLPPPPLFTVQDYMDFADFPPPPPDMLLVGEDRDRQVESTESEEKNDSSSVLPNTDSSSHTDSLSPERGSMFSPPVETYFTGTGEGPCFTGRSAEKSEENSGRSRVGDFRDVQSAVEKMAIRLKQPRPSSALRHVLRATPVSFSSRGIHERDNVFHDDEMSKTRYMEASRVGEKSKKQREPSSRDSGLFGLQQYHDQLDEILRDGDEAVSYSRFPEPFPLYDSYTKPPAAVSRKVAAISTPSFDMPATKSSRSRVKLLSTAGLRANRGHSLRFDSLSSESVSSDGTSSSSQASKSRKDSQKPSKRSYLNEVVVSVDGRGGYEFCSTISLQTSDLTKYSVMQRRKDIRTGREIAERFTVYGSGVTQKMLIERPRKDRVGWKESASQSMDDTLASLSYDYQSDNSDVI